MARGLITTVRRDGSIQAPPVLLSTRPPRNTFLEVPESWCVAPDPVISRNPNLLTPGRRQVGRGRLLLPPPWLLLSTPPRWLLLSSLSCSPHLLGSPLYRTARLLRFAIVLHSVVPISISVVPLRRAISWPAPLTPHVLFGRRRALLCRSTCTGTTAVHTCPPGAPAPHLASSSGQLTTGAPRCVYGLWSPPVYEDRRSFTLWAEGPTGPRLPMGRQESVVV